MYPSILPQDFCESHTYMSFMCINVCIHLYIHIYTYISIYTPIYYVLYLYLYIYLEINLEHTYKYKCIYLYKNIYLQYTHTYNQLLFSPKRVLIISFVLQLAFGTCQHSTALLLCLFSTICKEDDVDYNDVTVFDSITLVSHSSIDGHIYCRKCCSHQLCINFLTDAFL